MPTTYTAPLRDLKFVIHEFLDLAPYSELPAFSEASPDIIDAILEEGGKLCEQVLHPINMSGDEEGCSWNNHEVTTPKGFREAYQTYVEGGWSGLTSDPEYGGQGLPHLVGLCMSEMISAANTSFGMYPGLSHGAWAAIHNHGSQEQKDKYLPKLTSGEWTGTMNLTEPHCGTDLGLIRTKAEPQDDGSYRITGTKIWISAGEHDMAENIIHLVLARIPGAPEGTKGISLFIVPKYMVNDDGSPGERNGVRCESIEKKMGIKASATCEMGFDKATGFLVGEENKGLRCMFTMMNAARLGTGIQALGVGSVAYQNAVAFAHERLQMRALNGPQYPDKPADPIMVHPDVRRMLMTCRAFVEGARALALYTGLQLDLEHMHPDQAVREKAGDWVALMTPIIKAYFTDMGSETANLAMQVFGGSGYIRETGVEQFVRDVRITQIYEGTNGVQALDLVGRKLPSKGGETLNAFIEPVKAFIDEHQGDSDMAEFVEPLSEAFDGLQQTIHWLFGKMMEDREEAGAASSDFLRLFALVAMGYVWARQAAIAHARLKDNSGEQGFYESKLATARFFMTRMLPDSAGLMQRIRAGAGPVMGLDAEAF